jgi:sec-independent protein translocase protein TatC
MSDPARLGSPEGAEEVEASRAPLMEHLIELRNRLVVILAFLAVGFGVCFFFAQWIYNILLVPYAEAASEVRDQPIEELELQLVFLAPLEFFFVKLKLALFGAVMAIFPVIAWQIYAFVAPGLYRNERGAFAPFLVLSPLLFAGGAAFVYFVVLPIVMGFSLGQEQAAGAGTAAIQLLLNVTSYMNLVTTLMLVFGVSFQMPILMMLLAKAGILRAKALLGGWRFAVVGIALFAAFATPPDPISQLILGAVLFLLYFLSIGAMMLIERPEDESVEDEAE